MRDRVYKIRQICWVERGNTTPPQDPQHTLTRIDRKHINIIFLIWPQRKHIVIVTLVSNNFWNKDTVCDGTI